ncbi:MAG: TerB N-terminal domain-containing protein [Thermoplasmata archaeon]|nr:TerB N-terminal domain-containing protein [Thermoplasmata archaeon]
MPALKLRVTLEGFKPPITRTLLVPEGFTFRELEQAIDISFGRTVCPVRVFTIPSTEVVISDRRLKPKGDGVDPDFRPSTEPLAEHRGESILYTCDFNAEWVHRIAFAGSDTNYDRPYPTLIDASGPSPGDDFEHPGELNYLLRTMDDPDPETRAESLKAAERLGIEEPDIDITNMFLEDVTAGVDNSYYRRSTTETSVPGRMWEQGPPEPPGPSFFGDMDRLRGEDPGDAPRVPCDRDWPAYSDLSDAQLKWYLHWRAGCLEGRPRAEDLGYVWLYCCECADMDDYVRAETLMSELASCFPSEGATSAVRAVLLYLACAIPISRGAFPRISGYDRACAVDGAATAFFSSRPRISEGDAEHLLDDCMLDEHIISAEDFLDLANHVLADVSGHCRNMYGTDIPGMLLPDAPRTEADILDPIPTRVPRRVTVIDTGDRESLNRGLILAVPMAAASALMGAEPSRPLERAGLTDIVRESVHEWMGGHPEVKTKASERM